MIHPPVIRTSGLAKTFAVGRDRTVQAVRGIDLEVGDGELVAVLGPNGAGKTTTMRMLTTLVRPTSGTASVAGHDVLTEPALVRREIGYVGQGGGGGRTQLVRDEVVTQGRIYGLGRAAARARADQLLEALELQELARRKVLSLSGGQRRRLDVALGLVHAPRLLFLDEPSTGLDPHSRANLWEHILRLRAEHGMTVVLTTHYLDEADTMAERVIVVDHGRVIADDTADALKRDLAGDRIVVRATTADGAGVLARLVSALPGARDVRVDADRVEARIGEGPAAVPTLVTEAARSGVAVAEAQAVRPTLDDVFLALTGRSLRDSDASHARPEGADPGADPTAGADPTVTTLEGADAA